MTSSKQTAANRRNAQESTGPKSARGKQSSRMNALKHGLRATEVLIPDENWDEYEEFRHDVVRSLGPVGAMEIELAERIVLGLWRLRRCGRIEARLLGGGGQVMGVIQFRGFDYYAKNIEKGGMPEIIRQIMEVRTEVDPTQDPTEAPIPKGPFPHLSDSAVAEWYEEERDQEQQSNPLTYDIGLAFRRNLSQHDALAKLARYEATLDRALDRALHELQRLQAVREKHSPGALSVIDVDLSASND